MNLDQKSIVWYNKLKGFVAEINKDGSYISEDLYKELGGKMRNKNNDYNTSIFNPFFLSGSLKEPENLQIAIGMINNKHLILKQTNNEGITVDFNDYSNKGILNELQMREVINYYEYSILGLWVFRKENNIFVGEKY